MTNPTQESFLNDVKDHKLEILLDQGVYRHLKMTNGTMNQQYHIVTTPGHLILYGDMGSYTFSRIHDMFEFFIMRENDFYNDPSKQLNINPGYWAEKLDSIDRNCGYEQWDKNGFIESIKSDYAEFRKNEEEDEDSKWDEEHLDELWEAIDDDIISQAYDEMDAFLALDDFHYGPFDATVEYSYEASDMFSSGGYKQFTYHYIWGLYSIVYAITLYNASKTV